MRYVVSCSNTNLESTEDLPVSIEVVAGELYKKYIMKVKVSVKRKTVKDCSNSDCSDETEIMQAV
jgi:hypothetical protein